jgi:hypothetical protein
VVDLLMSVDTGHKSLAGGFFIPGGAVDLAGEEEVLSILFRGND